jgi:Protein of unknown function (DUF4242)
MPIDYRRGGGLRSAQEGTKAAVGVERAFPGGLEMPGGSESSTVCLAVVKRNAHEGVIWVHSYVSDDRRKTFCVYDAPSPKAIRKTAEPNELPPQVGVLEPYLYTREVV